MRIPRATYRLQFNPAFDFRKAREILPYLAGLGITDIYASPIFSARPGSAHGYDICDHNAINPELGGAAGFDHFTKAREDLGMGYVQDIVPNHMAVSGENGLLMDVLENGKDSEFFEFPDIDWEHPDEGLRGKMLAPFLGAFFGETLSQGDIQLDYDENGFLVRCHSLRLPLRMDSYSRILTLNMKSLVKGLGHDHPDLIKLLGILYTIKSLSAAESYQERYEQIAFIKRLLFEIYQSNEHIRQFMAHNLDVINGKENTGSGDAYNLLEEILSEQFYRLSFWKVAADEINYRRFFSVNDLICLRVEEKKVFDCIHRLIAEKVSQGRFSGLRVDHIDGLRDPTAYLERLRDLAGDAYIVVEKILAPDEEFPEFWPAQGTTGYDFLNKACGLFVNAENENAFNAIYQRFTGITKTFPELLAEKKRIIILRYMGGDIDNLARLVKSVSLRDRGSVDITLRALKSAIVETLAYFPVYRTYVSAENSRPVDRSYIRTALDSARGSRLDLVYEFEFLERFLLRAYDRRLADEERTEWLQFVMRFQQFTGPIMAKGSEDTALYGYNRLLCLNEVGGWPDRFGIDTREWHEFCRKRLETWPLTMNATSTHDTKRGEDARMRLAALSETPDAWEKALNRYHEMNAALRTTVRGAPVPDENDEYFLYEAMLASWPFFPEELGEFQVRLKEYLVKSVREAKVHTGWLRPDEEYEQAFLAFVDKLFSPDLAGNFLSLFAGFQRTVAFWGMVNSLSQTILKITAPGTPDMYQGSELWDLSFVDPDNRRPVDFSIRQSYLREIDEAFETSPEALFKDLPARPEDGRIKLFLIRRLLKARNGHAELFEKGAYIPLEFAGVHKKKLVGYMRRLNDSFALVIAPRLVSTMTEAGRFPLGSVWEDTRLVTDIPACETLVDGVTGRRHSGGPELYVKDALSAFPVALLLGRV